MFAVLVAAALQSAAPVPAAPACTATTAPPAGLEAWSATPVVAMGPIALGKGTGLMLQPVEEVAFAPAPGRAPKPGTFGGVYRVDIVAAGTYRIALGKGAWIDVVRDGKTLESVAHTEGPACSTIRKIVDFTLTPGRYAIQLSGANEASMRILIAAK